MDTNEESSLYLRYKTSAVFIRKYLSDELVGLYEFRIKDKAPEDVLKNKYLCEISELSDASEISLEDIISYGLYIALSAEPLNQAISSYLAKKRNYKKNWYRPIQEELKGKITPGNPESLRHYAEGVQIAKRYEKKNIDIEECMAETAKIIDEWKKNRTAYLTDFFFCPDKPDYSVARAFLYDITCESLLILQNQFNGSLEGFNMKVPSDFTTKPLSSYRTADIEAKPSITPNKEVVLSSKYTYQDEDDGTNVMDMRYTPLLPADFTVDMEMTEEQLVKKLNNFNIGVNVRELDTVDQAIVTQLFSMISGENIGEPFISCDFRDFVQKVGRRETRPRKSTYDDIASRLQRLKYLGYSYTEYNKETGDIKTQSSIGFINSINIDREQNILTFSPSAEWKNSYITNSYIQIEAESYTRISSYQTRAILMLLQQERLACYSRGMNETTLTIKFFRTHMKLIKVPNSVFIKELTKHLDTLIAEGVVVETYELVHRNTSVRISFKELTKTEIIAYGYSETHQLEDNNNLQ